MEAVDSLLKLARLARDEPVRPPLEELERGSWIPEAVEEVKGSSSPAVLYSRWEVASKVFPLGYDVFPAGYGIALGPRLPANIDWVAQAGTVTPHAWPLLLELYIPYSSSDPELPSNALVLPDDWKEHWNRLRTLGEQVEELTGDQIRQIRGFYMMRMPGLPFTSEQRERYRQREPADAPRTEVPLVGNDAELKAMILLRAAQQGFQRDSAIKELVSYLQQCLGTDLDPETEGEERHYVAVEEAVSNIIALEPDLLPNYLTCLANGAPPDRIFPDYKPVAELGRWHETEGARARPITQWDQLPPRVRRRERTSIGRVRPEASEDIDLGFSIAETTNILRVSPKRIYALIGEGRLSTSGDWPLTVSSKDVERLALNRGNDLSDSSTALFEAVQALRGGLLGSARIWARRRRRQGWSDEAIIREAAREAGVQTWNNIERITGRSKQSLLAPEHLSLMPLDALNVGFSQFTYGRGVGDKSATVLVAIDIQSGLMAGWAVAESCTADAVLRCWKRIVDTYSAVGRPLSELTVLTNRHPTFQSQRVHQAVNKNGSDIQLILSSSTENNGDPPPAARALSVIQQWWRDRQIGCRNTEDLRSAWPVVMELFNYGERTAEDPDSSPVRFLNQQGISVPEGWNRTGTD